MSEHNLIGVALVVAIGVIALAVSTYRTRNSGTVAIKKVEPSVILKRKGENIASYTEHTAVAMFKGGETKEYTFDGISRKDGSIVLYDYTGPTDPRRWRLGGSRFKKEVTTTIARDNLLDFETTNREDAEVVTEVSEKVNLSVEKAIEAVKENPDNHEFVELEFP